MKRTLYIGLLLIFLISFALSVSVFAAPSCVMTFSQNYTSGGTVEILINGSKAEPTIDGKYSIPEDATITLKATANKDFSFDYWDIPQGYGVSESDQYKTEINFLNPGEDFTVRAMFREHKAKYTVRIHSNEYGMGNFGHKDFAPGEKVKVDATAYDGFRFVRWIDDNRAMKNVGLSAGWEKESAIEFIMPERDVDLSLEFDFITYYFTLEMEGEGEVEVSGKEKNHEEKYECTYGEEILLSAAAAPDFVFVNWSVLNGAILSDFDKADTTLTCPASDFTVKVIFSSSVRNLVVEATPGGITTPTGERVVGVENIVELHATPDEGYVFSHWECSSEKGMFEEEKEAETNFTMPDEDCTIKAVFEKGKYELTLSASAGGKVEGEKGKYEMGEKLTVRATPFEGYAFSHWQCGEIGVVVSPEKAETDILIPGCDVKITAIFVLESSLSVQPDAPSDDNRSSFPWKIALLVFAISAIIISLVIVREYYNLSYGYLLKKVVLKIFKRK